MDPLCISWEASLAMENGPKMKMYFLLKNGTSSSQRPVSFTRGLGPVRWAHYFYTLRILAHRTSDDECLGCIILEEYGV